MTDAPMLARVDLPGVTTPNRSVVATAPSFRGVPSIFVHGIFENIYRWLTPDEANQHSLQLPDHTIAAPRFEFVETAGSPFQVSRRLAERGLLARLAQDGMPAAAFSYQDLLAPIAPMAAAIDAVHRLAIFAMDRWQCDRVQLVGHSRGGLVCRHALLCDSASMRAVDFRNSVHRLTTIATPHLGSRLAEAIGVIDGAIERLEDLRTAAFAAFPQLAAALGNRTWPPLTRLRETIATTAQLTPTSEEVRIAATANVPPLPGGYCAVAGISPVYFRIDLPPLGTLQFPPAFPIAELTEGLGDCAVAAASALDIPHPDDDNIARFNVNHFTNAFNLNVHDKVRAWLAREQ